MCEMLICRRAGHWECLDAVIVFGGAFGNFELNVMLPVIAYNLLQSVEIAGETGSRRVCAAMHCGPGSGRGEMRGAILKIVWRMCTGARKPESSATTKRRRLRKSLTKAGKTIRQVALETFRAGQGEVGAVARRAQPAPSRGRERRVREWWRWRSRAMTPGLRQARGRLDATLPAKSVRGLRPVP